MARKKPKISKAIRDAGTALTQIMRDKLTVIADDLCNQVMAKARRLTPSQKLKALVGLTPVGTNDYKDAVKTALSVMALDAIEAARKEVPKAKHVKLSEHEDSIRFSEFDRLPPSLQNKIQTQMSLLVGKQIGDLQKVIEFAYQTAEEESDSDEQVAAELNDSALGWLDSTSMEAGAELNAAKTINNARNAFFFDEETLTEIDAFQFMNGDPVTEICQDLAGTIFGKDDPDADEYFPPLHWNAIVSGITIDTINGPLPIEKLEVGMEVRTHKGRYRPVTEVMSKLQDKEYFEIELEDGKLIKITGEHPILTRKGWFRVDELNLLDDIVVIEDLMNNINF